MKKRRLLIFLSILLCILLLPCTKKAAAKEAVLQVKIPAGSKTDVIQKALNQATEMKEDGYTSLRLVLTPGSYELSDSLVIYSDTVLVAENCTLVKNHNKGPILRNYLYDKERGINYAHDIEVIGGIWNGGADNKERIGDESFRFIHARRISFKELTIKNIVAGHLLTLAGVEDALVEHCTFADYNTYGTGKEAVHLDVVHWPGMVPVVESSKPRIIYDDAPCKKIRVTNCVFRNVPSGIGSHSSVRGVYQEDIQIAGNTFQNVETAAIRCYNYRNITISGNCIEQAGIGIQIYTATATSENNDDTKTSYHIPLQGTKTTSLPKNHNYSIYIINNTIKCIYKGKEGKYGNGIYVFGCEKRPIGHLKISGNDIFNTKNSGIRLKYAPYAEVTSNSIKTCNHDRYRGGIEFICSDHPLVQKNQIKTCQVGIQIHKSSEGTYQFNTICGIKYEGIRESGKCKENRIYKNTVQKE